MIFVYIYLFIFFSSYSMPIHKLKQGNKLQMYYFLEETQNYTIHSIFKISRSHEEICVFFFIFLLGFIYFRFLHKCIFPACCFCQRT